MSAAETSGRDHPNSSRTVIEGCAPVKRIETLGAETYDTVGPSEADAATAGSVMRNVLPLPWTWWA